MDTQLAYEMICAAVEHHPRRSFLERFYDEQHFGNFLVSFIEDGQKHSVVNDRGLVSVTADQDGTGHTIATVRSLNEADANAFLRALGI